MKVTSRMIIKPINQTFLTNGLAKIHIIMIHLLTTLTLTDMIKTLTQPFQKLKVLTVKLLTTIKLKIRKTIDIENLRKNQDK